MSNFRQGRPQGLISFQNLRTARSQSPSKRVQFEESSRSRSLSPVKKSPTIFGLSEHITQEATFKDAAKTTAMSREQLVLLSQTPLSETLHITRNDYAIPVPFKLQMPPKLSYLDESPSSLHSLNEVPRKLIFTGLAYEMIEYETSFLDSRMGTPEKPPSTVSNRKKVARFVQNTNTIPLDQLSLIEEKSVNGESRVTSANFKKLPSLPDETSGGEEKTAAGRHSFHSLDHLKCQQETGVYRNESVEKPLPPPRTVSGPMLKDVVPEYDHGSPRSHPEARFESALPSVQNFDTLPTAKALKVNNNFPSSTTFHHNLYMAPPELRIGKRTFSDESCVSSVSSFSSVGDVLNFNHAYMLRPNGKGEIRVTSDVIEYLETERMSRQSSLKTPLTEKQIPPPEEQDLFSNASQTIKSPYSSTKRQSGTDGIRKLHSEPLISNLTRQRMVSRCTEPGEPVSEYDDGTIEPLAFHSKNASSEDNISHVSLRPAQESSKTEENNGAGIGFNFPNDGTNSTNDSQAKKRAQNQRASRNSLSFSSHFSNGQIEIPDLLESDVGAYKVDKDIEPLGVPSAAAVNHLKGLYGESSFDSDSEGSFNSQFHALQKKQAMNPQQSSDGKPQNSSSAPAHPLKNSHSRHRSMYNIDFDHTDFETLPLKVRPNSMVFTSQENESSNARLNSSAFAENKSEADKSNTTFKTPIKINSSKQILSPGQQQADSPTDFGLQSEDLQIKVAEAPKKVSYAVDFKDQGKLASSTTGNGFKTRCYTGKSPKKFTNPDLRGYASPVQSDIASSYKSSRTGQYTESTAPTDSDSVVIDLTKESYDICMINRNDSTTSYKSVIERTRDGKKVEVVLVEEDEDAMNRTFERDDLLSIYSHYMTDWDDFHQSFRQKMKLPTEISQYHSNQTRSIRQTTKVTPIEAPKFRVNELLRANLSHLDIATRKHSSGSNESDNSDLLGNSWMPSESHFQVKVAIESPQKQIREAIVKPKSFSQEPAADHRKATVRKPQEAAATRQSNHFDYHQNGSYDFNSFMLQTKH